VSGRARRSTIDVGRRQFLTELAEFVGVGIVLRC